MYGIYSGLTIIYEQDFYNNLPARTAFRRALQKWRCYARLNVKEVCNEHDVCHSVWKQVPSTIRVGFENDCMPLPNNTAYGGTSAGMQYVAVSPNGTRVVMSKGRYIAFDSTPSGKIWDFSGGFVGGNDAPSKLNFQSVVLHELAHFQGLKHVSTSTSSLLSTSGELAVDNIITPINDPSLAGCAKSGFYSEQVGFYKRLPAGDCTVLDDNGTSNPPPSWFCTELQQGSMDCNDENYPLSAQIVILPEFCQDLSSVLSSDAWETQISPYTTLHLYSASLGQTSSQTWQIEDENGELVGGYDCMPPSDDCRAMWWDTPGVYTVTLTITDSYGCTRQTGETVVISEAPNCTPLPLQTGITAPRLYCSSTGQPCPTVGGIGGKITFMPPSGGSGCYAYIISYNRWFIDIPEAERQFFTEDLTPQPDGSLLLDQCLDTGFYHIIAIDRVSGCIVGKSTVAIPTGTLITPVITQSNLLPVPYCAAGQCTGVVNVFQVNGAVPATDMFTFQWSDCNSCNTPNRNNLCVGTHTITVTDNTTGCMSTQQYTIQQTYYTNGTVSYNVEVPVAFNDITNVKINIPQDDYVTIKVYNSLGVPVKTLAENEMRPAGQYNFTHDATSLPNGVYYYVLKVCGGQKTDSGFKY